MSIYAYGIFVSSCLLRLSTLHFLVSSEHEAKHTLYTSEERDGLCVSPFDTMASSGPPDLPDYSDQGSRLELMVVVAIIFLVLSYISVALRIYVRVFMLRAFQLDDISILICLVRTSRSDSPLRTTALLFGYLLIRLRLYSLATA